MEDMEYSEGSPPSQPKPTDKRDEEKTAQLLQEYESLFNERPRGLGGQARWLLRLEKEHGKPWYNDFFRWGIEKLTRPEPCYATAEFLVNGLPGLRWQPEDPILELVISQLATPCLNNIPDLYIGQYNDHHIWLVVHGSALDPPTVNIKTFDLLGVQYAHLRMFAGLRIGKALKDELCVLTWGKLSDSATKLRKLA
jgi:hypothetical protein